MAGRTERVNARDLMDRADMIIFEGEGHGFRRADSIKTALEAQLFFLGEVFGFTPADELPAIVIDNLPA